MATELTNTIASASLENERPIWVRLPENRERAKRLVVFLDAELYRDRIGAVDTINQLTAERKIPDSWFVFVSMHSMDARWRECPCYPPFASFIGEELIAWLGEHFPETKTIVHRTLVGVSYTGLAAAYVAVEKANVFQKVISQSGSFWWNDCWLAEHCRRSKTRVDTEFLLQIGTRETQQNVRHREDVLQVYSQITGVRRFRDALARLGNRVEYSEFDGAHEFGAWQRSLPEALVWALGERAEAALSSPPST